MPLIGMPAPDDDVVRGHAEPTARRPHLGQDVASAHRTGRTARPTTPATGCRRAGCGSRSTTSVTWTVATRELPEQPRVDGAERRRRSVAPRRPSPKIQSSLVAEKYGSSTRPVVERTSGRCPSSRNSSQRSAVRRSCHTMARCSGSPVDRSHTTAVSRWSVMPMAAGRLVESRPERHPARSAAVCQISLASCSTQPGSGKYWGNSRYDESTMWPGAVERDRPDTGRPGIEGDDDRASVVAATATDNSGLASLLICEVAMRACHGWRRLPGV